MADARQETDLELPPAWRESTPPPRRRVTTPPRKRRRRSRDYDSGNSSDAPVFSSDDLADASLENYDTPRAKRLQKRAWYENDITASFAPIDSGVFLNSDSGSEDGFSIELQSSPIPSKLPKKSLPSNPFPTRPMLTRQTTVQSIIFQCLEHGSQIVDLSQRSLTALSSAALKPLHQLVLPPRSSQPSSSDSGSFYHTLKPSLELYLSQNSLARIPGEIMRLDTLSVLSLRHNKLTALPSSFSRLRNLCELNVSSNFLTSLPWELLHIIGPDRKLRTFTIHPNPMVQPYRPQAIDTSWAVEPLRRMKDSDLKQPVQREFAELRIAFEQAKRDGTLGTSEDESLYRSWILKVVEEVCQRWKCQQEPSQSGFLAATPVEPSPMILGSSEISWLGIDGHPLHGSPDFDLPHTEKSIVRAIDASCPPLTELAQTSSRVPSLFELALRECAFSPYLPDLDKYLPPEAPPLIRKALYDTSVAVDECGKVCSSCGSHFIIPRAQWFEYWFWKPYTRSDSVDPEPMDFAIPFLRQVCSWRCAQPGRHLPEHVRTWAKKRELFRFLHGWHDRETPPATPRSLRESDFLGTD